MTTARPSPAPPRGRTRRSADPARGRIWRSAWILPGLGAPIVDGALAVRDGLIVQIGPAGRVLCDHPDLPVEDRGEEILAPGLVDAHCHLEWSLLDGLLPPAGFAQWLGRLLPLRVRMAAGDHQTAARLGALRALESGTTTLADSGPTGAGAAALAESGLRGLVHLEAFGREEGQDAVAAADLVAQGISALDAVVGPRGRVGVSPHAPYTVGPDLWAALRSHPELRERPWTTHLAESPDEGRAIAAGDGPLGDLFASAGLSPGRWEGPPDAGPVERVSRAGMTAPGLVAAHCVQLGAEDPTILARAGVRVAHCPRSNEHLLCGRAPLESLLSARVPVGLGTDSPASGGDYDLRAEARACRRMHAGVLDMDDAAGLRLITIDGAVALGMEHLIGSLEVGKRADLIALRPADGRLTPTAAALHERTIVRAVVVDGEVLLRDGAPVRLGGERVRADAAEARGRLC